MKQCKNCDYGIRNELDDIFCCNSDSANCCEFMREYDGCNMFKPKLDIGYIKDITLAMELQ